MKLSDVKVVLIVGGTGYLGSAIVSSFKRCGVKVVLLSGNTLKDFSTAEYPVYVCDYSDESSVVKIIEEIENKEGGISICVYAAGQKPLRKKITQTTQGEMLEQFTKTTLNGFTILSVVAKKMKERKSGVLVGVTTAGVVYQKAVDFLGGYIPAKYALLGVLSMLKSELSTFGVSVYSVAPGFMEGGMNSDIPSAFVQMIKEKSPLKKIITKEEVAEKIVELCCAEFDREAPLTTVLAPEYE